MSDLSSFAFQHREVCMRLGWVTEAAQCQVWKLRCCLVPYIVHQSFSTFHPYVQQPCGAIHDNTISVRHCHTHALRPPSQLHADSPCIKTLDAFPSLLALRVERVGGLVWETLPEKTLWQKQWQQVQLEMSVSSKLRQSFIVGRAVFD